MLDPTSKETTVAKVTMVCGMLLLILGMVCYIFWKPLGAAQPSATALIPAAVGVLLMALGWLSLAKPDLRMHFMHGAVVVGVLGLLAAVGRLIMVISRGGSLRGVGQTASLIMALICGVFVVLSIRSFIDARKARQSG